MRKLAAVLCVVLMLAMGVTAFANPSIGAITVSLVDVQTNDALPEGMWIAVMPANPFNYANDAVKTVVSTVNDPEKSMTVKEAAQVLGAADPGDYDFVTNFQELVLTDGTNVYFDNAGANVSGKAVMTVDALKGASDISAYKMMILNPTTGEMHILDLDPSSFNAETGEITVDFPCLGAFSLIQK